MLLTPSKVYVLYVDHQGHPSPLSSCYHATGARRLSSSVERFPPSTSTEIDSAFCGHCLTPYDADTAARLGFCPKASCQRCPMCLSSLTLNVEGSLCFYNCGFCSWDSRGCGLTQTVNQLDDGSLSRLELSRALEELGSQLMSRRETSRSSLDELAKSFTLGWQKRVKQESLFASTTRRNDGPEGWSVETLEASLQERKNIIKSHNQVSAIVDINVEHTPLDSHVATPDESLKDTSQLALELQSLNSVLASENKRASKNDLIPLPMPLRARLSRRCRAELEEGRPGILLKPKLNPLEGDTSLFQRTGHGQWWKKVR